MKNEKIIKAIREVQSTKIMQEFYGDKWLEYVKKNYKGLSKEQRLNLLFRID